MDKETILGTHEGSQVSQSRGVIFDYVLCLFFETWNGRKNLVVCRELLLLLFREPV